MKISKQLPSKKVPNLRDLGGMIGADGKQIREGRLIRSAQLYNATKKDLALLESLRFVSQLTALDLSRIDRFVYSQPGRLGSGFSFASCAFRKSKIFRICSDSSSARSFFVAL